MTLEEALGQIEIGQSISQTIWTTHPESAGIEPADGVEYQIKIRITKTGNDTHVMEADLLATRQQVTNSIKTMGQ